MVGNVMAYRAAAVAAAVLATLSAAWPLHGAALPVAVGGAALVIAAVPVRKRSLSTAGGCLLVVAQLLTPLEVGRATVTALALLTCWELLEQADLPGRARARLGTLTGAALATGAVATTAWSLAGALPGWSAAPAAASAAIAVLLTRFGVPHTGAKADENTDPPR